MSFLPHHMTCLRDHRKHLPREWVSQSVTCHLGNPSHLGVLLLMQLVLPEKKMRILVETVRAPTAFHSTYLNPSASNSHMAAVTMPG